ncbi:GSCOCG00003320001-RA-CDS, partial [Cotesia congregata]
SDVELLDDSVIAGTKSECKNQISQTKIECKNQISQTKIESKSKFSQTQNEQDNKINLAAKNVDESIENKSLTVEKSEDEPKNKNDNPSNFFGIYQCWIGRDCYLKGNQASILAHIKNQHPQEFTSQPFKGWPHVVAWDLNYNGANTREDRAFEIQGVGLFVLHIFVTHEQHLKAHVLMFDGGRTAAQYRYEVEIKCDDNKKSFSAAVDSSRLPRKALHDRSKGLFINENSMLQSTIKMKMKYRCTVQIMKINDTNEKKILDNFESPEVETKVRDHKNPKTLNKKQFKPMRKNANQFKDKSKPGLLDLRNVKIADCSSLSETTVPPVHLRKNNPFSVPGNSQLYPNLQKEFNYQQMPPQNPHMANNNFNMNMQQPMNVQPGPFYPQPPVSFNEHYQRNAPPPAPPSAPHIDMESNFHLPNKPGNFTAANLERQKLIQRQIEEQEKDRLIRSGASIFEAPQEERRKYKNYKNDFDS